MSRTPLIAFVIVVLIIIGAGAWLFMNNTQTAAPAENQTATAQPSTMTSGTTDSSESAAEAQTQIEYTDNGFSPANITVPLGTTVTWTNNSTKQMWVASAPHPTHTGYSEFDQKAGSAPGTSYSFTFDKAGDWKFHDHLTPTRFGSVTVQ